MRTVFLGTPEWAVPALEALAASHHRPTLVMTQPAKRRGRAQDPSPSPVGGASGRLGIDCVAPESARDQGALARLGEERPDAIVVVAFGEILPKAILELPRLGCVNLHFSLLPRYRGAAPVQWAIANGETETGVTTMRIEARLDAGPVYLQERTPIEPGEHAPSLGERLAGLGARLLVATLDGVEQGSLDERPQDSEAATSARMLRSADGWIEWTLPAGVIARRVRAFDPWPGQSTHCRTGRLKILEARAMDEAATDGRTEAESGSGKDSRRHQNAANDEAGSGSAPSMKSGGAALGVPGTVLDVNGTACRIACGEGTVLEALLVRPEGRRSISGAEAVRGRHLVGGERLGGQPIPGS